MDTRALYIHRDGAIRIEPVTDGHNGYPARQVVRDILIDEPPATHVELLAARTRRQYFIYTCEAGPYLIYYEA